MSELIITTMNQISIEEIKNECKAHELIFRKGRFKDGNNYKISTIIDENKLVWPCKNLEQCREAITQASFLKRVYIV